MFHCMTVRRSRNRGPGIRKRINYKTRVQYGTTCKCDRGALGFRLRQNRSMIDPDLRCPGRE